MRRWLATLVVCSLIAPGPSAHHIMGIPHYAYDESYPQAPVITYAVEAGPYLVKVTGYPGRPSPNSIAEVHAYIVRKDAPDQVFEGPIVARLERDGWTGPEVIWGPRATRFDENLHKLAPIFGDAGQYRIRLEMELEGQPYEIDFPLVAGTPASPTRALLLAAGGLLTLVVVARATRIKLRRRALAAA